MQTICVYCGSSPGRLADYLVSAEALGKALIERKFNLVYGGASVGLMGAVADSVLGGGGAVIGVMPTSLIEKEAAHPGLTELVEVNSMHQRKAVMVERSDGFIAMPGGLGTLEELFEVLTWSQLGFHQKPCGLLNINGYYDKLLEFLDHAVAERFVKPLHRDILLVADDADQLLQQMISYRAPTEGKWLDR